MTTDRSKTTRFDKYSPSIAKLWKRKDRLNKSSHKGAQDKLDQQKTTAMRELNRTQNLLLRDKRNPSRPITRASVIWSSQDHQRSHHQTPSQIMTRSAAEWSEHSPTMTRRKRPGSAKIRPHSVIGTGIEGDSLAESIGSLSVRREATFCRSLNQVCNASEKEKRSWDEQVIRQHQVSNLDDKNMELMVPVRRQKGRDRLRNLKCRSDAFPEEGTFDSPGLLSSRSLIMMSSVFLTSSQSFQSEVPRYVRLRGNVHSSLSDQLHMERLSDEEVATGETFPNFPANLSHSSSVRRTSSRSRPKVAPYQPDEYRTTSHEDLTEG